MTAEVSVIPNIDDIGGFKKALKEWTAPTDESAGNFIALVSLVNSTAGKAAKETAVNRLKRKCDKCDEIPFDGYTLKVVRKEVRVYKGSAPLNKAVKELADLEAEKAKLTAEIDERIRHKKTDIQELEEKREFTSTMEFSHLLVQ
jgi:ASC-1-like (ASCH) protein